jgi:hypothetical protein
MFVFNAPPGKSFPSRHGDPRLGADPEADFYRMGIFARLSVPSERTLMENQRAATRHRTLKAGTIEFNGGGLSCLVRNMSSSGAALDVISPVGIPERFTLVVLADGRHLPCHVVWRKEKRIGIAFD